MFISVLMTSHSICACVYSWLIYRDLCMCILYIIVYTMYIPVLYWVIKENIYNISVFMDIKDAYICIDDQRACIPGFNGV